MGLASGRQQQDGNCSSPPVGCSQSVTLRRSVLLCRCRVDQEEEVYPPVMNIVLITPPKWRVSSAESKGVRSELVIRVVIRLARKCNQFVAYRVQVIIIIKEWRGEDTQRPARWRRRSSGTSCRGRKRRIVSKLNLSSGWAASVLSAFAPAADRPSTAVGMCLCSRS